MRDHSEEKQSEGLEEVLPEEMEIGNRRDPNK